MMGTIGNMTLRALVLARLLLLATRLEMKTGYLLLTVMWSVAALAQQVDPLHRFLRRPSAAPKIWRH